MEADRSRRKPGARSIQTYRNVKRPALGLGIKQVRAVGSKVRDEKDEQFSSPELVKEVKDIVKRIGGKTYDCFWL